MSGIELPRHHVDMKDENLLGLTRRMKNSLGVLLRLIVQQLQLVLKDGSVYLGYLCGILLSVLYFLPHEFLRDI